MGQGMPRVGRGHRCAKGLCIGSIQGLHTRGTRGDPLFLPALTTPRKIANKLGNTPHANQGRDHDTPRLPSR